MILKNKNNINDFNESNLSVAILVRSISGGGAERVASLLSRCFTNKYDLYIIVYRDTINQYEFKGKKIVLDLEKHKGTTIEDIKFFINSTKELRKIKKNYAFDYVISFGSYPNISNVITNNGEKKILSVRNVISKRIRKKYKPIAKCFLGLIYEKSDKIVACSKIVKKDLVKNFRISKSKIEVINNPYMIQEIQEKSDKSLENGYEEIFDNPVIINVGSLTKQKGQWHLIKSFNEIKRKISDAKLVILGTGELEHELRDLCNKLDIEKDVHFLGFQRNPFKFMKRSSVFVLSSLYEGFPNVVVESMACGTPVVSTDCPGGSREILAPNTNIENRAEQIEYGKYGILTPTFNEDKNKIDNKSLSESEKLFSKALLEVINNRHLQKRYSKLAKERAKRFKAEKIEQDWRKLIEELSG